MSERERMELKENVSIKIEDMKQLQSSCIISKVIHESFTNKMQRRKFRSNILSIHIINQFNNRILEDFQLFISRGEDNNV